MAVKRSEAEKEETKKVESAEPKSGEAMIPISQVEKMVQQAVATQMANMPQVVPQQGGTSEAALAQAIAELSKSIKKENYEGYDPWKQLTPDMIDKEDRLETPRVFWAPTFSYVIGGDKQNGRAFSGPFGVIKFFPEGSKRNQTGKEQNIFIWSKYICHSKKELDFLENHSKFGIKFFDRMAKATNIDVREATMVANFHSALMNSHFNQLREQAIALDVPVVDDIKHMRIAIAQTLAKKKMKEFRESQNIQLKEGLKSAMMVGQRVS